LCGSKLLAWRMTERCDLKEVVDSSECCVFSDLAETFRLGGRLAVPSGDPTPARSLFCSTFLPLLGENRADFISVGVPTLDEFGRLVSLMKPYRSSSTPSNSSQLSESTAVSLSVLYALLGRSEEDAPEHGALLTRPWRPGDLHGREGTSQLACYQTTREVRKSYGSFSSSSADTSSIGEAVRPDNDGRAPSSHRRLSSVA
jgi:hypothetical protein